MRPKRMTITHYAERPSWRSQWASIGAAAVLAVAFVVLSAMMLLEGARGARMLALVTAAVLLAALLLMLLYRRYSWRYTIDSENIESVQGIIARTVQSIRVRDLRNVNVKQTILQRLLGYGDVEFSSAGGSGVEVVFFGVVRPLAVKQLIQRLQDRA